MVATNIGKSGLALLMAGSGNVPRYCAIGSGSGAVAVTNGSLVAERLSSPRTFYTSRDQSVAKKITWIWDFTSTTMSGTILREFGVAPGSVISVQDLWAREGFTAVTFDGTNELQVEVTFEVF